MNLKTIQVRGGPYLNVAPPRLAPGGVNLGLLSPDVPAVSWVHSFGGMPTDGGPSIEAKNRAADWWEKERLKRGWPEMLLYNFDEPNYPNSQHKGMDKYMRVMRDVRVRYITAIGSKGAYGYGDLFDIWVVYAGLITPALRAEADRLGAEVWTYSCHLYPPESMKERYFAGYYVWANKLKGHTTWHHYAQGGYKNIWMRQGDKGPMPNIGWESRREGIDDYRYMTLLEVSIAARPDNVVAYEAAGWLESVRARIVIDPHKVENDKPLGAAEYDAIRAMAADYITRLGAAPAPRMSARPRGSGLKDEAKPFRNKTLDACIVALSHRDLAVRRAAALALKERRPLPWRRSWTSQKCASRLYGRSRRSAPPPSRRFRRLPHCTDPTIVSYVCRRRWRCAPWGHRPQPRYRAAVPFRPDPRSSLWT